MITFQLFPHIHLIPLYTDKQPPAHAMLLHAVELQARGRHLMNRGLFPLLLQTFAVQIVVERFVGPERIRLDFNLRIKL